MVRDYFTTVFAKTFVWRASFLALQRSMERDIYLDESNGLSIYNHDDRLDLELVGHCQEDSALPRSSWRKSDALTLSLTSLTALGCHLALVIVWTFLDHWSI